MAPLASEPRQVLAVLNLARRKALYTLLIEITAYMRSQLEFRDSPSGSPAHNSGTAPLFVDPSAEVSLIGPTGTSALGSTSISASDSAPPNPALVRIRAAAIEHFDAWRKDAINQFKELLSAADDPAILDQRRKRAERISQQRTQKQQQKQQETDDWGWLDAADGAGEGDQEEDPAQAVARLQSHWHPIPTRLATIPEEDRKEALSCIVLVLLSTGRYSAHSRAMAVYLTSALELPLAVLNTEEAEIAVSLVEHSTAAENQQRTMSAEAEAENRKQHNQPRRYWKVGLASVAGAALIGVTGGLAAPVVAGAIGGLMGSVGLGGVASFLGVFWMNGALVGTLFGALGARMTGEIVDQYAREVEDFRFIPLKDEWGTRAASQTDRRLRVTIGINGWLDTKDDVTKPWRALADDSEAFALRYEMRSLLGLGKTLKDLVSSYAWNSVKVEILKRTVLATLWSALWPAYLLSMASAVDNPFSLAKNRSEKAGEILADALINRVQGERPVTLIGYSLGARVIYSCLRSLAARRAFGLVDSVVFIGAPVPSNKHHWQMMRTVVSGKMFNVYSENDYLLAFLYRATSIQLGVAGLQKIQDIEGVENLNLSDEIQGHMRYAKVIGKVLAKCGVPVNRGAEEPMEDDEDAIKLDDKDLADLIQLDDLAITGPPAPRRPPPSRGVCAPVPATRPPVSQPNKQRTTVTRAKPSAVSVSHDLLGLDIPDLPSAGPSLVATPTALTPKPLQPKPQPQLQPTFNPPKPAIHNPLARTNTQPLMPQRAGISKPAVPNSLTRSNTQPVMPQKPDVSKPSLPAAQRPASPVLTSSFNYSGGHDSDDNSDEGGMGIKMVDNDDGLDYCDPTPLEDDEYSSWR
ncbi:hypothetical protein C8A05DRAFT_13412 [Staphylotrichum tortipilum]|uniref:DUF726-domain-containing protein n=1 Tax=Staphylotrichum tortipilum TaxID=2831512 RepID=A0AAN6MQL9_9PEZI|nr:hypothetical protein C8A05DRAFT_13412 [Staphylotrichum longicolle]